jgi:hypothetical protein
MEETVKRDEGEKLFWRWMTALAVQLPLLPLFSPVQLPMYLEEEKFREGA